MRSEAPLRVTAVALAGFVLGAQPALAAVNEHIEAVWVPRRVTFIYQGFTTHYSCDGLREKIRELLLKAGARDLKVHEYGCTRLVGIEPFPGVRVTMRVLAPASSAHGKEAGPVVAAHWHNVVLLSSNAGFQEQGNCELTEQFKETFLPLFTTRNIRYGSNCVPHQLSFGTHLSADVLMPDMKPGGR